MEKDNKQTVGSLSISDEVFATIAIKAASGVDGVAALLGEAAPEKKGIFTMPSPKAVKIGRADDEVTLDIFILVKPGANVRTVSESIQKIVKDDIQTMTGNTVSKVNVHVEDIVFEEETAQIQSASENESQQ